jgi:uncharacterized protein YycO
MATLKETLVKSFIPIFKPVLALKIPHTLKLKNYPLDKLPAISPGDVFLSKTDFSVSNLFIPGFWKHAAMYIGDGYIVEAVPPLVRRISISEFIRTKDVAAIYRPRFCSKSACAIAAAWSIRQINKKEYDLAFTPGNDSLYCVELIFHAYSFTAGIKPPPRRVLNDLTYIPDDLTDPSQWEFLWRSDFKPNA